MKTARRAGRSEALLFERERQGIRTLTAVRGLFVVAIAAIHWAVGFSLFEKIAATLLAVVWLVAIGFFLFLLSRRRAVRAVGLAGALMDVAILAALPVIWYHSVGGGAVPPAYMLKTQLALSTVGFVLLNALALRPLYPVVVSIGGIGIHAALLGYALRDPRTEVSSDFVRSVMGPALSIEFVLTAMFVFAIAGAAMGYLTHIARRTVVQSVRLEVANAQLGRYFSPGVVARVSSEDEGLFGPGGRSQDVAVMFCDIRGFTSLTETLPPSQAVALLSDYHARMVDAIFRHGGTIDKFIGDAIMVTFGTPDPAPDDAERSLRAGIAMNTALDRLNGERRDRGEPEIRHGIAIHYGPVIAGNIGTEDRLEYTVIGDSVNLASRIQDACKTLGEPFLVSEAVKERLPSDIPLRPLSEHRVKGREAPVRLYAVDHRSEQPPSGATNEMPRELN